MFPILFFAVSMLLSMLSNGYTATYYVATTGSDSNSCSKAQSASTPKRSINSGITCLASGDTLILKGGTYNEWICGVCGSAQIPNGGGDSTRTVIKGAAGETVIMQPPVFDGAITFTSESYVSVENLIIDGNKYTGVTSGISLQGTSHHIRFRDVELRFIRGHGATIGGDYHEFIRVSLHDLATIFFEGSGSSHVFYIGSNYNLFDGVTIDASASTTSAMCFHVYSATYSRKVGNIFRNNTLRNCAGTGFGLFATDNTLIENNVIYGGKGSGIWLGFGAATTTIRNNTLYGQRGDGIDFVDGTGAGTQAQNNIIYGSQAKGINIDAGSSITVSNNLSSTNAGGNYYDATGQATLSNNLFGNSFNPKFVNSSTWDFHLQVGSAGIDAGVTIGALKTDKDGTTRPQGSKYDIGAYEYRTDTLSPPANFQLVDTSK